MGYSCLCGTGNHCDNHCQVPAEAQHQNTLAIRLRRYFPIVLALTTLCAGAWIEREALLRGAADVWIVSDPITPADAVVVLGGGIDLEAIRSGQSLRKRSGKKGAAF
jgi:hypothetical protein